MIKKTGLRLIATSTANRTFASQIEELKTAFVAHSGGIIVRTLNMYSSKYYTVSGTSISANDRSLTTNANALKLYA